MMRPMAFAGLSQRVDRMSGKNPIQILHVGSLLLALLILLPESSAARTIVFGRVVDWNTGQAVPRVEVELVPLGSDQKEYRMHNGELSPPSIVVNTFRVLSDHWQEIGILGITLRRC